MTHFISQQRVGGLSVSLISAAGAANSHSASGERFQSEAAAAAFEGRTTFSSPIVVREPPPSNSNFTDCFH